MEDHCKLLEGLELTLLEPSARADSELLIKLIAEDFIEVGANGRTFGKNEVLNRLPTESGISFRTENMHIRLLAPTVGLITYTATRCTDSEFATSKRCSIWHLNSGQWQMVFHQGTPA